MKVGDLIKLRLPYMKDDDTALLLQKNSFSEDPTDAWWTVLMAGEVVKIHQDFVREVINENR